MVGAKTIKEVTGAAITGEGGGSASRGRVKICLFVREIEGGELYRSTHTGVVQAIAGALPDRRAAEEVAGQREQCIEEPGRSQFCLAASPPLFSIGQFAGQGVPFKHCQDACVGSIIASIASVNSQPHSLRLFERRILMTSLISAHEPEKFLPNR